MLLNLATCAFSLQTCRFELVTHRFELVTRGFYFVTHGFELVTSGFELATRGLELVTRGLEHVTRRSDLVTRNLCFTFPLATIASWHIYNPRNLSRQIMANSERCLTLEYWEPCHIKNFAIFSILAYLGPEAYSEPVSLGIFMHNELYSTMIVIITLIFFFFTLTLHTFLRNYKKTHVFYYREVNLNARLSLLIKYRIFQNNVLIE